MKNLFKKSKIETALVVLIGASLVGCSGGSGTKAVTNTRNVASVVTGDVELPKVKPFEALYRMILDGLAVPASTAAIQTVWVTNNGKSAVPQVAHEQLNGGNFSAIVNLAAAACTFKVQTGLTGQTIGSDARGAFKNTDTASASIENFNKFIDDAARIFWSGSTVSPADRSLLLAGASDVLAGNTNATTGRQQAYIALCIAMTTAIRAIQLN